MHVEDAIQTLLAVRAFTDQPVSDEVIHRILEAGRLTASSQNRQPWHFIVVRNRATLSALADAAKTGPYIAGAAFAIVVAVTPTKPAISDASRAIQDMMLVGWDHGLGSNWVGSPGRMGEINTLLGIPDDIEVVSIVPFGYPAHAVGKGRKQRKPLEEIVHWERWENTGAQEPGIH